MTSGGLSTTDPPVPPGAKNTAVSRAEILIRDGDRSDLGRVEGREALGTGWWLWGQSWREEGLLWPHRPGTHLFPRWSRVPASERVRTPDEPYEGPSSHRCVSHSHPG